MASITKIVQQSVQPRGGYINPKTLTEVSINDNVVLHDKENVNPGMVGAAVDYLTRFMNGSPKEEAFRNSIIAADRIQDSQKASELLSEIAGLDDTSIVNACRLAGYDIVFGSGLKNFEPVDTIQPDQNTIENIRTMVDRSNEFFKEFGPVTQTSFYFTGAYTPKTTKGNGEFLTKDMIANIKVSSKGISGDDTLLLLIFYIMGMRSTNSDIFANIKTLAIFNPRLNSLHSLEISNVPEDVIETVATKVIGY